MLRAFLVLSMLFLGNMYVSLMDERTYENWLVVL